MQLLTTLLLPLETHSVYSLYPASALAYKHAYLGRTRPSLRACVCAGLSSVEGKRVVAFSTIVLSYKSEFQQVLVG
jgi:hypothetical protein